MTELERLNKLVTEFEKDRVNLDQAFCNILIEAKIKVLKGDISEKEMNLKVCAYFELYIETCELLAERKENERIEQCR